MKTPAQTASRLWQVAWAPWLAWSLGVLAIGLAAIALALILATRSTPLPPAWGFRGFSITFAITFSMVGALVASRRPGNPIGWLLCGEGILASIQRLVYEYAVFTLLARPGSLPGGEFTAWVDNWIWVVGMGPFATLVLLLFPNGRLPTPRWRPAVWLGLGGTAIGTSGLAVAPGPLNNFPSVQNPFGIEAWSSVPFLFTAVLVPMVVAIGLSAVSLVVRFRRAETQAERHQLKWFAYAGAFLAVATVINQVEIAVRGSATANASDVLLILSALGVPIAIGTAVLRYRLYDIDLVINRTLVYVPLTAILAGAYLAAVGVFKTLVTQLTEQSSDAAVALTTLLVVALFTPFKNSIQGLVDRYFKEAPDATRALAMFEERIRPVAETLNPELMATRFLSEVARALQAECGAVSLIKNDSRRLVCTHGAWVEGRGVLVPLKANGREVGELWLAPRRGAQQFTTGEMAALQRCADTIASALMLANRQEFLANLMS